MKVLAFLGFVILLLGCRLFGFEKMSLVRLQNDTNFDVKISVFQKGSLSNMMIPNPILIEKGKFLEKAQKQSYIGDPFLPIPSDSVVIIFDAKKILIQSCKKEYLGDCLDIINNLNRNRTVESIKSGKYSERYTHRLTQIDYDRAVPFNN